MRIGARVAQLVKRWASATMVRVRSQLSTRDFLEASLQRGGFTCRWSRLSSALKSSRIENTTWTLRTDTNESWDQAHKTRVVISTIKPMHTYICMRIRVVKSITFLWDKQSAKWNHIKCQKTLPLRIYWKRLQWFHIALQNTVNCVHFAYAYATIAIHVIED